LAKAFQLSFISSDFIAIGYKMLSFALVQNQNKEQSINFALW
jgi:hypothetical protein